MVKCVAASENASMTLCRDRLEITRALSDARHLRGLSQLQLDDLAGWTDGYTSKLEQPVSPAREKDSRRTGRCAMHMTFDLWLKALGVAIIVVPDFRHIDWENAQIEQCIQSLESTLEDMRRAKLGRDVLANLRRQKRSKRG